MGVKYYQVGGAVRDKFLGQVSKDIDYVVEAEDFGAMRDDILRKGGKIFIEKPQYFTIRANLNGAASDFVLARKDGIYSDGRRPDSVEKGTIFDDLARRDCTMNAIAIDENGDIIDPFNGVEDITQGIIRAVGDPVKRINEDYLRVFRYLRFSIVFDFIIDPSLEAAINGVYYRKFESISIERIQVELDKMFRSDPWRSLKIISRFGWVNTFLQSSRIWFKPTLEER